MRYPVTLTRDDNGTFLVTFPDVPEAITYGETRDEALARAPDAFATAVEALMKDRRDIPPPSRSTGRTVELPTLMAAKLELYRTMRAQQIGKAELGRRLDWHLPQVDRLLAMKHGSQLDQLESAFRAMGKRVVLAIEDGEPRPHVHAGVLRAATRTGHRLSPRRAAKKR
jgi:antitoxin HicB